MCNNTVVLTGYWPPTNEMLRPFSTRPEQNPDGWQGRNWRNTGWDVYAFFPEFPPDGDPVGDPIGSPGSVGSEAFDFPVDYQRTSADFWRIMARYQPTLLITTSRGGEIGWELEAVEGGHQSWVADGYGNDELPTRETIDPRSWQALMTYSDERLLSQLPINQLYQALAGAGETPVTVAIDWDTSGNYLSGFMGLHGLYYNATHPHNRVAGHIHVGRHVSTVQARYMLDRTLEIILTREPAPLCRG